MLLKLCMLLIGCTQLLLLVAGNVLKEDVNERSSRFEFALMLDAGSTGTRSHIYKMTADRSKVEKINGKKITPGLSSFRNNPLEAFSYLRNLLDHAKANIPPASWDKTEVYIYATAGMRFLTDEEQDAIYNAIYSSWDHAHYPFQIERDHFRTISGDEEGFFAMLSVNYLTKRLSPSITERLEPRGELYGALDLGGSSTQILFEVNEPASRLRRREEKPISLSDFYVHSFLGYGAEKMREKLIKLVLNNSEGRSNSSAPISHPCYFKGYEIESGTSKLVGSGNANQCIELIRQVLHAARECQISPCSFDGVHQPQIRGSFYAMSMYYYAVDFARAITEEATRLGIMNDTYGITSSWPTPSPLEILTAAKPICSMDWNLIGVKFATLHSQTFSDQLPHRCLEVNYIAILLSEGYGLSLRGHEIVYASEVDGVEVEWTLGAFLKAHADYMMKAEQVLQAVDMLEHVYSLAAGRNISLLVLGFALAFLYGHIRAVQKARTTAIAFYKETKLTV